MAHDISTPDQPAGVRAVSLRRSAVSLTRQTLAGLRVLLVLTVLLGVVYPLAVLAVGQAAFPWQANGSLVRADGSHATSRDVPGEPVGSPVVGSVLLGQAFDGPGWFHPRPSAAGDGYDTLASGGSNLGPLSPTLVAEIEQRRAAVAAEDGVDPSSVPADALTASGSGLDPHVSPAYAALQVDRVAAARGLDPQAVAALVAAHTQGRDLGFLGEPRVDVLTLNLALGMMSS